MNLLITGGLGHIGSFFLKNLDKISSIKNIYVVDANFNNNFHSIFKSNLNKKIFFYLDDVLNFNFSKLKKIDYILHLASHTNAENSVGKKNHYFNNNLNCFKKICQVAKKYNSKLIHVSSTSIYGKSKGLVDENEKKDLKPQSPYAEIKLQEEKILQKKKFRYITLRFGTIAGVSKGIRFHTAVNKFCLNACTGADIPIWKTALKQVRPYLSLSDAFNAINFIIKKDIFDREIYNLVTSNLTVGDIISTIKKIRNRNIKIRLVNSKIMNQLSYNVSRKKFEKKGFNFRGSINKDIKETIGLFDKIL